MPNASARGVKTYLRLKGLTKAKEFQKIRTEEWLNKNLRTVAFSEDR